MFALFQDNGGCARLVEIRPVAPDDTQTTVTSVETLHDVAVNCTLYGYGKHYRFMIWTVCDKLDRVIDDEQLIFQAESLEAGEPGGAGGNVTTYLPGNGVYAIEAVGANRRCFHCTVVVAHNGDVVIRDVVGGSILANDLRVDHVTPLNLVIEIKDERVSLARLVEASRGMRYFAVYDSDGQPGELFCYDKEWRLRKIAYIVDLHASAAIDTVLIAESARTIEFTTAVPEASHIQRNRADEVGRLVLPVDAILRH